MLKGYFSDYNDLYEEELRQFVKKTQMKNLRNLNPAYLKRFFRGTFTNE